MNKSLLTTSQTWDQPTKTEQKIRSFDQLPVGWHFGQGVPAEAAGTKHALRLLSVAAGLGYAETDAFAGVSGEVRLTIYDGKSYAELTVEPDENITFVREEDGEEVEYTEGLSVDEAVAKLIETRTSSWATSGYFTPTIMTAGWAASRALHLRTPLAVASQFSSEIVHSVIAETSALTLESSISLKLATLRSSGTYPKERFQSDTASIAIQAPPAMSATVTSQESPTGTLKDYLNLIRARSSHSAAATPTTPTGR